MFFQGKAILGFGKDLQIASKDLIQLAAVFYLQIFFFFKNPFLGAGSLAQ